MNDNDSASLAERVAAGLRAMEFSKIPAPAAIVLAWDYCGEQSDTICGIPVLRAYTKALGAWQIEAMPAWREAVDDVGVWHAVFEEGFVEYTR